MGLEKLKIDSAKLNEGEWVESPKHRGLWAKVRPTRNPDFRRASSEEMRKSKRRYGNQPVPVEVEDRITARLIADHVLLDLKYDEQPDLEYTRELALELLTDPEWQNVGDFIVWAASTVGESLEEEMEADAKNSVAASSGTPPGGGTKKP